MQSHEDAYPDTPDDLGRRCLYSVTVIGSLLLLILHKGLEANWVFLASATVICMAYSMTIGGALILSLLINGARGTRIFLIGPAILVMFALLAWHTGSAYQPDLHLDAGSIFLPYVLCLILGLFILTPFMQVWRDGFQSLTYARLYQLSWDNALTILTAIVFTAAGWLLFFLLAGLFSIIGIDFFESLFEQLEFIYPVSGLLIGFGIGIGRSQIGAIRSALNVCLSIARPLLPLISGIAVVFLLALGFNNLEKLWETGTATTLLLCLIVGTVTLLNAVYQDGKNQNPYGKAMQTLVGLSLLTLPLFSAIAAYAVYLRVEQYGWSVDRLYAALFTGITSLYSIGYAISYLISVFKSATWLGPLARVNIVMALALAATLLCTQTPLLDFRNITVNNQLARLHAKTLSLSKLDLSYFRFDLGVPGYQTLIDLQNMNADAMPPGFHARIKEILSAENRYQAPVNSYELIADIKSGKVRILPEGSQIPEPLLNYLDTARHADTHFDRSRKNCNSEVDSCYLISVDISDSSENEWLLVDTGNYACHSPVFSRISGEWSFVGYFSTAGQCNQKKTREALNAGNFNSILPTIRNLKVGEQTLQFQSSPTSPKVP